MPQEPNFYLIMGGFMLVSIAMMAAVSLRGWRDWIDLKHAELKLQQPPELAPSAASRIEVADLKERIKKLEAIAAGIDI